MDYIKINKKGYLTFYDKKLQATRTIGKSTYNKDEDYKIYSDFSKKYYLGNKDLLPKRINYNRKNELFYVSLDFKGKNFHLGTFHTFEEAEQQLLDFKIFLIK